MTNTRPHGDSLFRKVTRLFGTINNLLTHPIGRNEKTGTLKRFVRWQLGSRILDQAVVVPYMNGTRLVLRTGMHGMTMNFYVGLHEFEDMMFVAHLLRKDDEFIDVGANAGEYAILAASGGTKVLALEPVPTTYEQLLDNIHINRFHERIDARNMGIGRERGNLRFSTCAGPTNHVLTAEESDTPGETVAVDLLDIVANDWNPIMMKIDVEGFEANVIAGATHLLNEPSLQTVLIELNGLGARYGFNDDDIHNELLAAGFQPASYEPFARRLTLMEGHRTSGNTLYVRDFSVLEQRLREAASVQVAGIDV
jgi:FkbM family methyltransferase